MSNKYQILPGDIDELRDGMNKASDKEEFRRFQAVYLRKAYNLSVKEISEITCFCIGWVQQLHSTYRHEGVKALFSRQSGGRYNENMGIAEEERLSRRFWRRPEAAEYLRLE